MALFNSTSQTKADIDDTAKLVCSIENAQNINKHTEYTIRAQRGPRKENNWIVSRRYRDFSALHLALQQSNIELSMPPKKLIGNMHPSFIAERQVALQNYINEVLKHQILALSLQVRAFLDPTNYSTSFSDQALQTVSIALRGEGRYELRGPLPAIGWRIRKHYFLVTDTESKSDCMLSWQSYGPDRCLCDKDLQTAFRSLRHLSHPYIDQILAIHNLETGAYVVRRIHEYGTLRDVLYGTEYAKSYLSKYGNPKVRKPLTTGQLSHYGYQILQALKFLQDKGIPHGHIHPGNIAIVNSTVQLLDIENCLLGGSSLHRPFLAVRRRSFPENVDAYCFGRTLYEMAFAEPLQETYYEYPEGLHHGLESIFRVCLSSSSKLGTTTLDDLLYHPFFSVAPRNGLMCMSEARCSLKFPLTLKGELKRAVDCVEERLKADQKMERIARREVRIQEILGSEEQMKKQRRKAKKRDSVWKSSSSLAETVRSPSVSTASSPTPPAMQNQPAPSEPTWNSSVGRCHGSEIKPNKSIRKVCNACKKILSAAETSALASSSPTSACANGDGRSALLGAICSFDKSKLSRVSR